MNQNNILRKTKLYIRERLENEVSGHDWWHVYRVWKNAVQIGRSEKVDLFVVQLTALLHDIADWKFHAGDAFLGPKLARKWLEKLKVEESIITHVCTIIQDMSFKGAGVKSRMETKEGRVVQDADRLDAIGAIGIARTFAYGGFTGRKIYDPKNKPKRHKTFKEYKRSNGPTLNHFYEKLLILKHRMNTKTAKKISEKRHKFMEEFLNQFFDEWKGKI